MHLKSALFHIRRSPYQALAALFILSITFFVTTVVLLMVYSSSQALMFFESRPKVIAFIKDDVDQNIVLKLQSDLLSDFRVKEVNYVSKEKALEIYKEATSENPLLTELVSPSIFPASIEFSLTSLEYANELVEIVKQNEAVESVGITATLEGEEGLTRVVDRLKTITYYIRIWGGIFAGFLVGTSFLVLLVIVSMRMVTRRDEIEVLRLIGATPGFIRAPILIEAIIYSLMGVFFGWLMVFLIVLYSVEGLLSYFGDIPILPGTTSDLVSLFVKILFVELLVGALIALTGSLFAVRRSTKKAR